jgi:hypothetical protein
MSIARDGRRDDLFLFAQANPDGITVDDIVLQFGWNMRYVNEAIRDLRLWLGETDTIAFPCDPQGHDERWLYRLVGNMDDVRWWTANRMKDSDSRLRTMQATMSSIVNATKGNTKVGRKARVTDRALRRLIEDLDDIELNGAP